MSDDGSFKSYARLAIEEFENFSAERRYMLVDAVGARRVERVLDVGCGAGQQLLPFAEKTQALCVGLDLNKQIGAIGRNFFCENNLAARAVFVRAAGEHLPFAAASFDVVICRVALPYMNARRALTETARVLKPDGYFFLKTHAPPFYFAMIRQRIRTLCAKQIAYPLFSLVGGAANLLIGKQFESNFWKGKEIFQTRRFIERELKKNGLRIEREMPDSNAQTPSFLIRKI
jgi:ubiquinone/menaquinone biosynthesis C-methylase UbiE